MINLSHDEALLMRLLSSFFGKEQVIPHMSVMAVCGGQLPLNTGISQDQLSETDLIHWSKQNKCLFTVLDQSDNPKVVFEFFSGFEQGIEIREEEHQKYLRPILKAAGIKYITITNSEFAEILSPNSSLDFISFLKDKFGLIENSP